MKLLRHSAVYFAGRILPALIGVFAVSVYTRLLEPSEVGTYALIASVAAFAAVGFNWLRVAMLRQLGSAITVEPAFIRTVALLFAATAAAVSVLEVFGFILYQRSMSPELIGLAVGATISIAWFDLNVTLLQARREVVAYGVTNLTRAVATLAFSVGLIALGTKSRALLGGFILGNVTAALLAARAWCPAFNGSFDRGLSLKLMRFGWPMTVGGALNQLTVTFDRLLLGVAAGTAAVGVYAVAYDFSRQTVLLLIAATALAGQPLAIRMLDLQGVDAVQTQLRENIGLMLGVAFPAVAGLVVLAVPIANTVLGPNFRGDAPVVIAMIAFSTSLSGVRMFYVDQAFELARHTRPQAIISGIIVIVGIACSVALIPRLGALGAAYSSITSNVLGMAVSIVWAGRVFRMPLPGQALVRSAIATAAMVLVLRMLPSTGNLFSLALDTFVGAVIYAGTYFAATVPSRALAKGYADAE